MSHLKDAILSLQTVDPDEMPHHVIFHPSLLYATAQLYRHQWAMFKYPDNSEYSIKLFFLQKSKYLSELRHEISNNVVCVTSKGSDQPAHNAQSDQSLC